MGPLEHTCCGHSLLGVPASVQRTAVAISMPPVRNGCWGVPWIVTNRAGEFNTAWLSSLHKAQSFVLCAGGDGFLTGSFEHFCHFHVHRIRGFNPSTQSLPVPPSPPPLTNSPFQHIRLFTLRAFPRTCFRYHQRTNKASEATFVFPSPLMLESFLYHAWMIPQSNVLSRALCKRWF